MSKAMIDRLAGIAVTAGMVGGATLMIGGWIQNVEGRYDTVEKRLEVHKRNEAKLAEALNLRIQREKELTETIRQLQNQSPSRFATGN